MYEAPLAFYFHSKHQRDGVGREVGEGSGYGDTVHLWLIHADVWQKPPLVRRVTSNFILITTEKYWFLQTNRSSALVYANLLVGSLGNSPTFRMLRLRILVLGGKMSR